jgi:hypothetical protein
MSAGFGAGENVSQWGVVGGADIDGIDVVAFNDLRQSGFPHHPVGVSERPGVFVTTADDLQVDLVMCLKKCWA